MVNEKYIIIIDTNFLGTYDKKGDIISKNFNYLSVSKNTFLSLIDFVNSNSLADNISIAIPKVVIDELKEQEKRDYFKNIALLDKTFTKFNDLSGFELKKGDLNFDTHLSGKIDAFIGKYNIIKVDYPPNDVMPKLIEKVLKKHKPFYKNYKNDSGFKDAIIWESILGYAKSNKKYNYIFLTKDPDFKDEKLLEEFENIVGSKLIIKEDLSKVKGFIDEHVQLKLEFNALLNLYNQIFREKIINMVSHCYPYINHPKSQFRIIEYNLSPQINDIRKISSNEYELIIPITLKHETEYTGYGVVDDLYSHYEYNDFQDIVILKIINENGIYSIIDFSFVSGKVPKVHECTKTRLN